MLLSRLAAFLVVSLVAGCMSDATKTWPGHSENSTARGSVTVLPEIPARPDEPIVITDNRGGNVLRTIHHRNQLARWGGPVEIRGYCGSACTLYLSLPNACVGDQAVLGFHAPRVPQSSMIQPEVARIMANFYRAGVLERWNTVWSHQLKIEKISASEYRALDPEMRRCD